MKKRLLALFLAVTLLASFLAVGAQALVAADFSDVPEDSWYYEDVDFVAKNELMQGYPDGSFKPSKYLTREELMAILARMDNTNRAEADKYDLSKCDEAPFADVAADRWSAPAIQWAKEKGITVGNSDDSSTFNPTGELTRQELATFVDRFVIYYLESHPNVKLAPKYVVEEEFPDLTDAASWAQEHITACRVDGLIYGFEDGLFHPYRLSTRAQIAAIIHRLCFELQIIPEPTPGEIRYYHTFTLTYHFVDEAGADLQAAQTVRNTVETSVKSVTFTVLDVTPTREGYTFKEWNTKADGTGTAYAPTAKFTTDKLSNDLYTIWTRNDTLYTLTYDYNLPAGYAPYSETTDPQASNIFTLKDPTPSKIPEGMVLQGWSTEPAGGDLYKAAETYTAPVGEAGKTNNSTVYAQWQLDNDYIGKAVSATIDLLNENVFSRTESDGELARGRIDIGADEMEYNDGIDPDNTRTQEMNLTVELDEELLPKLITFAGETACTILESTGGLKREVKTQANAIVNEIANEIEALTGFELPDYELSEVVNDIDTVISDVRKAASDAYGDARKTLGETWKKDGKYIAKSCTIKVLDMNGDQVGKTIFANTASDAHFEIDGAKVAPTEAAATFGRNLVKALAVNLKTYDEYVDAVELYATVEFTFEDSVALHEDEQNYPHVYPVDITLDLISNGLIEYKYESGGYLRIVLTEETQQAFDEQVEELAKAALSNRKVMETLNTELQKAVQQVIEYKGFTAAQTALNTLDSENGITLLDYVNQWAADNHFKDIIPSENGELSDFYNSELFKRFWYGGEFAYVDQTLGGFEINGVLHYDDQALLELLDLVAQFACDTIDAYLMDKAPTMYSLMMGGMTWTALRDTADNYLPSGNEMDALKSYPALMEYVFAKASDLCHERAAEKDRAEDQVTAERITAAMLNVENLIEEKMPGKATLEKITGLKTLEGIANNASLGEIAKLLENGKVRDQLKGAGAGMVSSVKKVINKLPKDAIITLEIGSNKIEFSKTALKAITSASTTDQFLTELAKFLKQPGLKDLKLIDFETERLVEITFKGETHSFHFGLRFE